MTDGFFINLHKALVIPVVLGFMLWFRNYSPQMWLYLGLHGSYAMIWLLKQAWFPDKRFDVERPVFIGLPFVFLPLASYYVAPFLLAWRQPSLPAWTFALVAALFTFGVFFHYAADAQKYFELRERPRLIDDGLFTRTRNPNYFGEILIYCAFATLSAHWLPFIIVALWAGVFFVPGMIAKDKSLVKYPDYAAYKMRSWPLVPRLW
jgi:protein-S-isoprenylcysteine O-methyltransferase Ste14